MKEISIPHQNILNWAVDVFTKIGLTANDAEIISNALVKTSLWGTDSHGIARITHYLGRFENGTIHTKPQFKFIKTAAATGQLDGDHGHGIIVMNKACEYAVQLAKEAGTGVIGITNSSHCGAIGLFTRQITESGMIGFAFTHADSLVVPHGGNKPFFGTNPISISFPTEKKEEPVCLDMATSIVPWNYIMNAKRESKEVPSGLGVDKDGKDTTHSKDIIAVKPMAEHKGYALAFLIDLLCGPLNGMNFGPNMTSMYNDPDKKRELGSLIIAIDPDKFGGKENVMRAASNMINQIRNHGDDVLFPGEPEYLNKEKRIKSGIPVSQLMLEDFNKWSAKLGVVALSV